MPNYCDVSNNNLNFSFARNKSYNMFTLTVENYKDCFIFEDNGPIVIDNISQEFINGFIYAKSDLDSAFDLDMIVNSDGKIPESYCPKLLEFYSNEIEYQPESFNSVPGFHIEIIPIDQIKDRVAQYNKYWKVVVAKLIETGKISNRSGKYSGVYNDNAGDGLYFNFDSLDFLLGFETFCEWNLGAYYQMSIFMEQIHIDNLLCHRYYKYDSDLGNSKIKSSISNCVISFIIGDLIDIVAEYCAEICQYKESNNTIYRGKYIHCETVCDFGETLCHIHKDRKLIKKPFKVDIRPELATD